MSLEALAARVDSTHASLSRIERGVQPCSLELAERIAKTLKTDLWSLLNRRPDEPGDAIWAVWEKADEATRRQLAEIAQTLVRGRTR